MQPKKYFTGNLLSYSAYYKYDVLHFQKTSDSSNESDIVAQLGFYKQTTLRKYMLHWSRTCRSFITQKIKIHKILLSCALVIHVNARMLKTKASNPRPGSRPRPDTDKAKD